MGNLKNIRRHEIKRTREIARRIIEKKQVAMISKILLFPFYAIAILRYRRSITRTSKNLFFTQQLAMDAAEEVMQGTERNAALEGIDARTREILEKEGKGLYTEKIRRKQFREIECLLNHYLRLLKGEGDTYGQMVKAAYNSKKEYLAFLKKLRAKEQEVIQASVATVRTGSKKDRMTWFRKVQEATQDARREEADVIFRS